jgi:hypothetical protein
MENKQARKTSSATMIEWKDRSVGQTPFRSFDYQDFGYRELEMSRTPTTGVPKSRNAKSQYNLNRWIKDKSGPSIQEEDVAKDHAFAD